MNGCTLPGRMTSCAGAACFGCTTETAVRATCAVSTLSFLPDLTRDQIPVTKSATATISAMAKYSVRRCGDLPVATCFGGLECTLTSVRTSVWGGIVTPIELAIIAGSPVETKAGVT